MRLADPYSLRMQTPRDILIFAASQLTGEVKRQEDYFLNFNDECFVLADGVGSMPNGQFAAKFACETAIWGYKHIRQRPYYWADKKLFMKRIFRSTNMAIWQKRREDGFEEGLATTLMVCMVGPKTYWLGVAGDSSAWHIRGGTPKKLTPETTPFAGPGHVLGMRRLGLVPEYLSAPFRNDDLLVLATDGCANYLTPQDLTASAALAGSTMEEMTSAVTSLVTSAKTNGSVENMTAVMIKRVATR